MPKINPKKETLRIIGDIRKRVCNKAWLCMCDDCTAPAINSHLLMQHGVLNHVVADGHVYELQSDAPQAMKKEKMPISFKRRGISQAISFPVFCKTHDDGLFEEIEKREPDYSKYRHIALYSYRALCAEYRKKEIEAEVSKRISESITLWDLMGADKIEHYKYSYTFEAMGLQNLAYYKDQLQKDLDNRTESYEFLSIELPVYGIYASTISSMFASEEDMVFAPILNTVFIHLIPQEASTHMIIGYHKDHYNEKIKNYVQKWKDVKLENLGVMLTALLSQIETWGMSPSLFERLKPECIQSFYDKIEVSCNTLDQSPVEDINLFEGVF